MQLKGYEAIYLLRVDHQFVDSLLAAFGHWKARGFDSSPFWGWTEQQRERCRQEGIGWGRRICINPYVEFNYAKREVTQILTTYGLSHSFESDNKRDWHQDKELERALKYWLWIKSTYRRERKPDKAFLNYCRLRKGAQESTTLIMKGIHEVLDTAGLHIQDK
jgi:hypothetical protein